MILRRFYDDKLAQASFLLGCSATGEAIVIDPNRDVEAYLRAAAAEKLKITAVTETHIHADFVSGATELALRSGADFAELAVSDEGGADWRYGYADESRVRLLHEGDSIRAGNVRLDVMHTPGHTPEHISFVLTDEAAAAEPSGIFTGDFVFVGDVGRPDLLERAANVAGTMERGARDLFRSLRRLRELPGHLMLWPGHGAGSACGKSLGGLPVTTLHYERATNWALRCEDEDEFMAAVLAGQPEPPVYFKHMKRINQQGPPLLRGFRDPPELAAAEIVEVLDRGALIVDIRASAAFEAGAIPGTLHIPMGPLFTTWAGWLLPYDRPSYLLASGIADVRAAVRDLAMIGIDRVAGWFAEDALDAYEAARVAGVRTAALEPEGAAAAFARGDWRLLDVRGRAEYEANHVPGAIHIPLGELEARAAELGADRPIAVHCAGGTRSPIAVSVLRRAGFSRLLDVRGGFGALMSAGLPLERGPGAPKAPTS